MTTDKKEGRTSAPPTPEDVRSRNWRLYQAWLKLYEEACVDAEIMEAHPSVFTAQEVFEARSHRRWRGDQMRAWRRKALPWLYGEWE